MQTVLHKAETRGYENHGWLNTYHTFSFANYFDPERIEFGTLRVINEDRVQGGTGFGVHPHENMEIITIPLSGALQHGDSMGNKGVIRKGEVQVMSAGTGITHSEMNANEKEIVHFLQIWVQTNNIGVEPRYGQVSIKENRQKNDFQVIVTPEHSQQNYAVWIYQDAWFSLADFDQNVSKEYTIKKAGNGVYIFLLKGSIKIGEQILDEKDGLGIHDTDSFAIESLKKSEFLIMDIPHS